MKIVAPHDRPREKLERVGAGGLGDNELLAIVLGHGVPRASALELANAVLDAVGGLHGLARASTDDLRRVPGIGGGARLAVDRGGRSRPPHAAAGAPRSAAGHGRARRRRVPGAAIRLPAGRAVRRRPARHQAPRSCGPRCCRSARSTPASSIRARCSARPRSAGAAALVLFHNHPSGDPTPSGDDVALTRRMVRAGELMGISVLDHVIVAENRFFSLKERGDLLGCVWQGQRQKAEGNYKPQTTNCKLRRCSIWIASPAPRAT